MSAMDLLKSKLRGLGIYNLEAGTLVHAELMAYAAALDEIYSKLEETEREMFVDTAESYGLLLKEKAFGYERENASASARRTMLKYTGGITSNDFNKEKIEKALLSSGIRGYLIEVPSEYLVHINSMELIDNGISSDEAEIQAKKFMPAHIQAVFDFRELRWEQIEDMDLSFSSMDTADLTWNEIDNYE